MLMLLLYSLREAQVLMRCPEVAEATIASVVFQESQRRCSWGSGFGILKAAQQSLFHTKSIFKILNFQIHRIHVFSIQYILFTLQIYYRWEGKCDGWFLPVNPLVVGFWQSCKSVTTGQPLIHWLQGFITFRLQHHPGQDHPVFIHHSV